MSTIINYFANFRRINRSLHIRAELGGKATLRLCKSDTGCIIKEECDENDTELMVAYVMLLDLFSKPEDIKDESAGE